MRCPWKTRSVTGRSEATTTGPIVSGGTKCASMTSIWMTSAYGSTSLTWSARCAKSADRIEAESTPIAAIVPARSGPLTEGGDEHAVGTMPMRPQPHPGARPSGPSIATGSSSGRCSTVRRRRRPSRRAGTCRPSRPAGRRDAVGRRRRTRWPPGVARGRRGRLVEVARATRARRRADPMPEHGASTSTRSNVPSIAGCVPSCATTRTGTRRRSAVLRTRAARSGRTSPATTRPVSPTRHAACAALPPGAAHTSRTRSPGWGSSAPMTNADAWSCTANQPCAKPRNRAGSPPSTSTQSGWSCAGRGT